MTFFQPVHLVGPCGQKPFSRKPGRARPVDGGRRGTPAHTGVLVRQPPFFVQRRYPCQE
jgi:hypothetical protein